MVLMLKMTLVIACIFSGCAKAPPYVRATDVTMKQYCTIVAAQYHIKSLGFGGFFEHDKINGFYADFESSRNLSKEEAKDLLTSLVTVCVKQVNHDGSLAKHFAKTPITYENISISIGFVGDDRVPYHELSQIHLFESKIFYSTYDPNQKTYVCTQSEALSLENETAIIPPISDIEMPLED